MIGNFQPRVVFEPQVVTQLSNLGSHFVRNRRHDIRIDPVHCTPQRNPFPNASQSLRTTSSHRGVCPRSAITNYKRSRNRFGMIRRTDAPVWQSGILVGLQQLSKEKFSAYLPSMQFVPRVCSVLDIYATHADKEQKNNHELDRSIVDNSAVCYSRLHSHNENTAAPRFLKTNVAVETPRRSVSNVHG